MRRLLLAAVLSLLLLPAVARAGGALAVVTEAGGVDEGSVRTARGILQAELRANGVPVVDDPAAAVVGPPGEALRRAAAGAGATAIYALGLSPLGRKLYVRVEELDAELQPRAERHLQAAGAEELDLVIPRLVKAIVAGRPVEATQSLETLTAKEGRAPEKKPGESMWGLGVLGGASGAVGYELRWAYEMEHVRLDIAWGAVAKSGGYGPDVTHLVVGAAYVFGAQDIAPYLGARIGRIDLTTEDEAGEGLGVVVTAGVELFRLRRARLLLEAGGILPLFRVKAGGFDTAGTSSYRAVAYGGLSALW